MKSYLSIAIFVILLSYTAGQGEEDEIKNKNDNDVCTTVNEEYLEGTCIPLRDCPQLIPNIKSSLADREFLKMWHCGFEGFVPKVCCPPLETTTLPPTPHNRCKTQSGSTGSCVPIKLCPKLDLMMTWILRVFDQNNEAAMTKMIHFSKYRCGESLNNVNVIMHVCCETQDLNI